MRKELLVGLLAIVTAAGAAGKSTTTTTTTRTTTRTVITQTDIDDLPLSAPGWKVTDRGNWTLDGEVEIDGYSHTAKDDTSAIRHSSSLGFSSYPNVGYFIAPGLEAGGGLELYYEASSSGHTTMVPYHTYGLALVPSVRKYVDMGSKDNLPFGQLALGLGVAGLWAPDPAIGDTTTQGGFNWNLTGTVGVVHLIRRNFGLETGFQLQYENNNTHQTSSEGYTGSIDVGQFSLGVYAGFVTFLR